MHTAGRIPVCIKKRLVMVLHVHRLYTALNLCCSNRLKECCPITAVNSKCKDKESQLYLSNFLFFLLAWMNTESANICPNIVWLSHFEIMDQYWDHRSILHLYNESYKDLFHKYYAPYKNVLHWVCWWYKHANSQIHTKGLNSYRHTWQISITYRGIPRSSNSSSAYELICNPRRSTLAIRCPWCLKAWTRLYTL